MIYRLECWLYGHSYAVFHYFTNGRRDEITCCRCGKDVVFNETTGWWVTK